MNIGKKILTWLQNQQQRVTLCTVATVVILFLVPGIAWYLIYALWILNSIWSFFQTSDRTVRTVHAALVVVLAVLLLLLWLRNL